MVPVESSRRPFQLLTLKLWNAIDDLLPLCGVPHYTLSDLAQQRRLRMPQSSACEDFSGFYVQVEPYTVGLLPAAFVPEVQCQPGLVRALVLGEAYVSVDAEQGPPEGPWVPGEVRADGLQLGSNVFDEPDASVYVELLISRLVPGEPLSVVVLLKLGEEFEEPWREVGRGFFGHNVPFSAGVSIEPVPYVES